MKDFVPDEQTYEPKVITKEVRKTKQKTPLIKFASFLFVMGIIAFVLSTIALLAPLISMIFYLFVGIFAILTLGLILLNKDFQDFLQEGESFGEFTLFLNSLSMYGYFVTMGFLALAGLIMFLKRKSYSRWTVTFVVSIVFIVLSVAGILLQLYFHQNVVSKN